MRGLFLNHLKMLSHQIEQNCLNHYNCFHLYLSKKSSYLGLCSFRLNVSFQTIYLACLFTLLVKFLIPLSFQSLYRQQWICSSDNQSHLFLPLKYCYYCLMIQFPQSENVPSCRYLHHLDILSCRALQYRQLP